MNNKKFVCHCGCTQMIKDRDELRCDDCDLVVAELINGEWVEF